MSESEKDARAGVRAVLDFLGEDPDRNGLRDTPARFVKMLRENTCGYDQNPQTILGRVFEQDESTRYNGLVVLREIDFFSTCEHHLATFGGVAHVVYIPNESGLIVGISKLARLVECFARRLQVQERMTAQIAGAIEEHLQPLGVMVVVEASHACMACRGVRKARASMVTSEVRGIFQTDLAARAEALDLIRGVK